MLLVTQLTYTAGFNQMPVLACLTILSGSVYREAPLLGSLAAWSRGLKKTTQISCVSPWELTLQQQQDAGRISKACPTLSKSRGTIAEWLTMADVLAAVIALKKDFGKHTAVLVLADEVLLTAPFPAFHRLQAELEEVENTEQEDYLAVLDYNCNSMLYVSSTQLVPFGQHWLIPTVRCWGGSLRAFIITVGAAELLYPHIQMFDPPSRSLVHVVDYMALLCSKLSIPTYLRREPVFIPATVMSVMHAADELEE